jgi:flagellar motility protein MotE (MotC chaperone)
MDTAIFFKNAGKHWLLEEDVLLNKLYNEDKLDIIEISKIHRRTPSGIISRLIKHNYIERQELARGYIDYKNSNLYNEIVSNKKDKNKTNISDNISDNILISIKKNDYLELRDDIKEMKNEIKYLQETIKELIKMMIYTD